MDNLITFTVKTGFEWGVKGTTPENPKSGESNPFPGNSVSEVDLL